MNVHLFLVQKINEVPKINRGGWTGFGTATVGIDPNTFEVLNGHPTKIPTDEILGGVVQNFPVGYQRVISGLSVGYQWVISGLSEGYQWVISGLSEGYQRVISRLSVGYQ